MVRRLAGLTRGVNGGTAPSPCADVRALIVPHGRVGEALDQWLTILQGLARFKCRPRSRDLFRAALYALLHPEIPLPAKLSCVTDVIARE